VIVRGLEDVEHGLPLRSKSKHQHHRTVRR
jgi:hypothetical protein